jgi:uncharacterized membrane protein
MSVRSPAKPSRRPHEKDRLTRPYFRLAVPAALGLVLSTYLWFATGAGTSLLCPAGSGCEIVLSSRYAWLLGAPLPVYGLAYYGAVLVLALARLDSEQRRRLVLPVTAMGAAASVVFTGVQQFVLNAVCPLCIVSAALSVALLVLVSYTPSRSASAVSHRAQRRRIWPRTAGAVAAALLFVLGGYALPQQPAADGAYAEGLARHLVATGATFYGTYWCRFCAEQKRLFGQAAAYLPYVECDPRSPRGQPAVCARAGVRAYPTWVIGGQRFEGVIPLADLARLSGYRPPP